MISIAGLNVATETPMSKPGMRLARVALELWASQRAAFARLVLRIGRLARQSPARLQIIDKVTS
jgi:hypothetical protein